MPQKAPSGGHYIPAGPLRLLDTCFRQLRYECIEPVIDSCYHAMQQLVLSRSQNSKAEFQYGLETPRGTRYSLFRNVAFEELSFHEFHGAILRLSYDCPRALQGRRIHSAGLFEENMLCALIGLDEDTTALTTIFFEVHLRESTVGSEWLGIVQ